MKKGCIFEHFTAFTTLKTTLKEIGVLLPLNATQRNQIRVGYSI